MKPEISTEPITKVIAELSTGLEWDKLNESQQIHWKNLTDELKQIVERAQDERDRANIGELWFRLDNGCVYEVTNVTYYGNTSRLQYYNVSRFAKQEPVGCDPSANCAMFPSAIKSKEWVRLDDKHVADIKILIVRQTVSL